MECKDIFAKAADLIEERGLSHDFFKDEEGCLCIMGGVGTAMGYDVMGGNPEVHDSNMWYYQPEVRSIFQTLKHFLGLDKDILNRYQTMSSIIRWNDNHSKEEVVSKLREAAIVC